MCMLDPLKGHSVFRFWMFTMPTGCVCKINDVESKGKRNQPCCTKGFGDRNQASSDSDYKKSCPEIYNLGHGIQHSEL